ncbi:MAG: hypothetical protein HRU09_20985 [Oligoflexales bacterium]|nr:hypothetical protein [Oligoflexales bacterium]
MFKTISIGIIMVFFCIGIDAFAYSQKPIEDQIYGVEMTEDGPVFQLYTGGCTEKEDFKVEVLRSKPVLLHLLRLKPDYCKAYHPYGTKIKFSFEELGLAPFSFFKVVNPRRVVQVVKQNSCS